MINSTSNHENEPLLTSNEEPDSGDEPLLTSNEVPDSENRVVGTTENDDNKWRAPMMTKVRILTSFWMFGLCNNFGYSVMLTAAYDILESTHDDLDGCKRNESLVEPYSLICNKAGTGMILLADILPTLLIKFTAPFFMHRISYNFRILLTIIFSLGSFVIVGVAGSQLKWLSVIGVVFASVSSGIGEIVFLSYSSHFHKSSVSSWSSGTGAAGVAAALIYSGLTQVGVTPKTTLFIMLSIPLMETVVFYFWCVTPDSVKGWSVCNYHNRPNKHPAHHNIQDGDNRPHQHYTLKQMLLLIQPLLQYMIPLMIVYMAEYFINQALVELLYFPTSCSWLSIKEQYRWFSTTYQIGVLISRSSLPLFRFRLLWILPILQVINLVVLLFQVICHYMPETEYAILIIFAIILWEGLLGGLAYANTFYAISEKVSDEHREFSMGIASCADTTGIVLSAFLSIIAHNALCNMNIRWS